MAVKVRGIINSGVKLAVNVLCKPLLHFGVSLQVIYQTGRNYIALGNNIYMSGQMGFNFILQ